MQYLKDDRRHRRVQQKRRRQGNGGVLVLHPADHAPRWLGARLVLGGRPRGERGPAPAAREAVAVGHAHARHRVARLVIYLSRLSPQTVLLAEKYQGFSGGGRRKQRRSYECMVCNSAKKRKP